ncbi:MAG TPA: alpha-glucosidase/alpha-galactosidase [Dehalococcoidia bacterium]|nr:alpha-glucosidase/alpha-galactosidase [Dehalococcoidia bacterium]
MTRIVVIGVGSTVFGVEFLRDVFQQPELAGADLWLVDLDGERLAGMGRLAERLNEASGLGMRVRATTDRREALPGADFVVTSVAVDRERTWRLDHELALRHGFPSVLSENAGPGGLSHTLRSVPLMLDIAKDVERLAPNALLLNYTNPENRVCLAIRRYTSVRAVGLCHGVANTVPWVAWVLGMEPQQIDLRAAGVNHFAWTLSLRDARTGADLEPAFRERLRALPDDQWPLCRFIYDRFGVFPTTGDDHVGEFFPWAAEIVGTEGYDFEGFARRRELGWANVLAWGAGEKSVEPLLAKPSHEARVNLSAGRIIADVVARRDARKPSFIVPNDGYIGGLPQDAVVEVPGRVAGGVARGEPVGALPGPIEAMVRREIEIQMLAVDAAVRGSRALALEALLLDPVVHSARAAEAFLDDVLRLHAPYLPTFR